MEPLLAVVAVTLLVLVVLGEHPLRHRLAAGLRRLNQDNVALWEAHIRAQRPWEFADGKGSQPMWDVHCAECGHDLLVNAAQVQRLVNLASGVIAVEARCPAGHPIQVLTGRATWDQARPRSS